jgi:hypothetical protein
LPPRLDLLVLVLRGVDGMPAITLHYRDTLRPDSFSATGLPSRLDLLVLVLRGVDGMPAITLHYHDTFWPNSFSAGGGPGSNSDRSAASAAPWGLSSAHSRLAC